MKKESIPYNEQYVRAGRNLYIRQLIWWMLRKRGFTFGALCLVLNETLKAKQFNERHFLTEQGLAIMAGRNCEGAWMVVNGVMFRNRKYHGPLRGKGRPVMKDAVLMVLSDMVKDGELYRDKGSRKMSVSDTFRAQNATKFLRAKQMAANGG